MSRPLTRLQRYYLYYTGGFLTFVGALAVLERLQVSAVRLERELSSGLVHGTLLGGPLAGRPVV